MFRHVFINLIFIAAMLLFNGCDQEKTDSAMHVDGIKLNVWAHAGQEAERKVLQSLVVEFNKSFNAHANNNRPGVYVKLTFLPEQSYNAQVQAAALAGDLPDILEFDGPYLYNYIWQNHLLPLETRLPQSVINNLLPSIVSQGTYQQHLYSVGMFDSGLGLYARKSALEKISARIPHGASDAWSIAEFNEILTKLAKRDKGQVNSNYKSTANSVLDLKLNYVGEWFTYGFSPILQSANADLVNRAAYKSSSGTLNNATAVSALQHVQNWIKQGWVDPNLDDAAFVSGRVVFSWVGHWEYARYKKAWQDDLIIVPLPDFGHGSKTGQGSWSWGVSKKSSYPEAAVRFIRFLLEDKQVLRMSKVNGAVPATRSAVQQSRLYGEHGDLHLFAQQLLQGNSVARPKTPGYPAITIAFQEAFQQIRNGGNVKQALDNASKKIDQDINDNHGYPYISR